MLMFSMRAGISFVGMALVIAGLGFINEATARQASDETIVVFDEAPLQFDSDLAEGSVLGKCTAFDAGRTLEAAVELPANPADQTNARRLVATIIIEPVHLGVGDGQSI